MIKKLQRKFVLIAIISVFCVLAIIIAAINVINYAKIATYADNVLNLLHENNGRFPLRENDDEPVINNTSPQPDPPYKPSGPRENINAETPYETRYFTVRYQNSKIISDVKNIAAISSEQAISLAEEAVSKGKARGYIGIYRFLISDSGDFVLFVDCAKQIDTAEEFLKSSLLISGTGLAAVFILILILSKYAVKPISESYEKQKRFITDASHELKTPLTIISANNELTELTTGETQTTRAIDKQVCRMTAMVKNLTALARLDETEKLVNRVRFSLTDTLIDISALFRAAVETDGRTFSDNIEKDLYINGDEKLIRQVFSLLLDNASKYAKTHTSLRAYKSGKTLIIELKNDAKDVMIGNLDKCFERFYRTDEVRASDVPGNGIGLSVAKSIVELHGGTIAATGLDNDVFQIRIIFPSA